MRVRGMEVSVMPRPEKPLRILAASEVWQGADSYAYVRAFRRAGHSVAVVDAAAYLATGWRSTPLRMLRRAIEPWLVEEHAQGLVAEAERLKPHLFFAFKGSYVTADAIRRIKAMGAIAINLYPDVSVTAHTAYLPKSLPHYDWIFTTKTFGLADMERELHIREASFIPPAFDPEVHAPFALDASDIERYGADVSFIGTWSPKKERTLQRLVQALPDKTLKIWGWHWEKATAPELVGAIQGRVVIGVEYAKCIAASRINLGLLSEVVEGASSGDLITARTFHIPATGGFMLHERTPEVIQYFEEGRECALFGDDLELIEAIRYYLDDETLRETIAAAGRKRSLSCGYSVDHHVGAVIAKCHELTDRTSAW
jgi:spore maturation protein CgeB